jgi:biotin carboxyl carrier protein
VRRVEAQRAGGTWAVSVDGRPFVVDAARIGSRWSLLIRPESGPEPTDGIVGAGAGVVGSFRSHDIFVEDRKDGQFVVYVDGCLVGVSVPHLRRDRRSHGRKAASVDGSGPCRVAAPMPGRVVKVLVRPGDVVEAGQGLVVVEAMKMENELRSPTQGTVTDVLVTEGSLVNARSVLVVVA